MKKNGWHLVGAWIACFAIMLATLAPSLTVARTAQPAPDFLADICTVATPLLDAADFSAIDARTDTRFKGGFSTSHADAHRDSGKPGAPHFSHFEHCPFCSKHAPMLGMPPAQQVMPAAALRGFVPALFHQASRPLVAWTCAQPRAPPSIA